MHNTKIPQYIKDRVVKRRGKLNMHEKINPKTSALLVIDMQNNLFLTESGKVYVHNDLLVADLESQELKVLSEASA